MTDEELKGIAAQCLNLFRKDQREGKNTNALLASIYLEDGIPRLHRMEQIEAKLVEVLGPRWIDSGAAKDVAFGFLRTATDSMPPDGFAIVTAINRFRPTAAFDALSEAEQRKVLNEGHDGHHRAVERGLMELEDGMSALVQTAERGCLYVQTLDQEGELAGRPDVNLFAQAEFDGRLKMYGQSQIIGRRKKGTHATH